MAISQEIWDKAKVLFEIGKSLNDIELETNIPKGTISKKSKKENWVKNKIQPLKDDIVGYEKEKETLDKKKGNLLDKIATLSDFEITILNDVVEDETKLSSLVTSTASLALIRTNQMLKKGTKQVAMKVTDYSNGKPVGQSISFVDMELESQDIKNHVDAIDKASITLGVNERFSKSSVEINNANVQQENKQISIIVE